MLKVLALLLCLTSPSLQQKYLYNDALAIPEKKDTFEFWLDVHRGLIMGNLDPKSWEGSAYVWDSDNATLKLRSNEKCASTEPVPLDTDAVTGDGVHKWFISVNGRIPGPPLVVWHKSNVIVHVTNHLELEPITVHWHGQLQKGSFWFDGAGNINQCPIRAGETFTYRFVADPPGTYFYHGHFVADRGEGLIGALIVLSDEDDGHRVLTSNGTVTLYKEYAVVLHDWYEQSAVSEYSYAKWGLNQFRDGWKNMDACYGETKTYDGSKLGELKWHSNLINGKGWHNATQLLKHPLSYPIGRYIAKRGQNTMLRLINAGIMYPSLFSVQGHKLRVVAGDGNFIKSELVDYVVLSAGERYDVILEELPSSKPRKNYIIVSQSLEMYKEDMSPLGEDHYTLALLEYDNGDDNLAPLTVEFPPSQCDETSPCMIYNCPFGGFSGHQKSIKCLTHNDVHHLDDQKSPALKSNYKSSEIQEFFLNVYVDKNMNGLSFQYPKAPPALFPGQESLVLKSCEHCPQNGECKCTQVLNLRKDVVTQITLYNREQKLTDSGDLDAFAHPIHIHGHHFYVVAVRHPVYDDKTGLIQSFNDDLDCGGNAKCNAATWKNESWLAGNVPGINLLDPPLKDTVQVPVGGYAVIRFEADNPGYWIAHCHMLPHHLDGMALLIKEGEIDDMPKRPTNYPQCFKYSDYIPSSGSVSKLGLFAAMASFVGWIVVILK